MKTGTRRVLLRSGIVIALSGAVVAILTATGADFESVLKWFDFLSPVPGLSGIAILVVGGGSFLLLLLLAQWVFAEAAGDAENRRSAKSR